MADFGHDPRISDSLRGSRNCFLVRLITHDFADFPSDKFYISTQQRQSVRQWKLSEQNFENFITRGRFPTKMQKLLTDFPGLVKLLLQAVITLQWLQIAGNSLPNGPSTGCLVSIFTVRITSKSFPWAVCCAPERYLPKCSERLMCDIAY